MAYVGKTRAEVIREWGTPSGEWDGHFGNPSLDYTQRFGPAKTIVYRLWSGSLYVSFHGVDGEWVCFASAWQPRGRVW